MTARKKTRAELEAARREHREQIEQAHQAHLETPPAAPEAHRTGMYYGSEALVVGAEQPAHAAGQHAGLGAAISN